MSPYLVANLHDDSVSIRYFSLPQISVYPQSQSRYSSFIFQDVINDGILEGGAEASDGHGICQFSSHIIQSGTRLTNIGSISLISGPSGLIVV